MLKTYINLPSLDEMKSCQVGDTGNHIPTNNSSAMPRLYTYTYSSQCTLVSVSLSIRGQYWSVISKNGSLKFSVWMPCICEAILDIFTAKKYANFVKSFSLHGKRTPSSTFQGLSLPSPGDLRITPRGPLVPMAGGPRSNLEGAWTWDP